MHRITVAKPRALAVLQKAVPKTNGISSTDISLQYPCSRDHFSPPTSPQQIGVKDGLASSADQSGPWRQTQHRKLFSSRGPALLGCSTTLLLPCLLTMVAGKFELQHMRGVPRAVICIGTGKVYPSVAEATRDVGSHSSNIHRAIKKNQKAAGYFWTYVDDDNIPYDPPARS
eukprot:g43286.t1